MGQIHRKRKQLEQLEQLKQENIDRRLLKILVEIGKRYPETISKFKGIENNLTRPIYYNRSTIIHFAASIDKIPCADLVYLLQLGIDPNLKNMEDMTPLVYCDTVEKAKVLLEHGANATVKSHNGWTVIYIHTQKNQQQSYENMARRFYLLIEYGLDYNHYDFRYRNLFHEVNSIIGAKLLYKLGKLLDIRTPEDIKKEHQLIGITNRYLKNGLIKNTLPKAILRIIAMNY